VPLAGADRDALAAVVYIHTVLRAAVDAAGDDRDIRADAGDFERVVGALGRDDVTIRPGEVMRVVEGDVIIVWFHVWARAAVWAKRRLRAWRFMGQRWSVMSTSR
jgi:hypothetical protein